MKSFEGIYGNEIALDYRRSKLPAKIREAAAYVLLTALLVAGIAVFGFAMGVAFLLD